MRTSDACPEAVVHLDCGVARTTHTMQLVPMTGHGDGLGRVYVCLGCQVRVLVIPADPTEAP